MKLEKLSEVLKTVAHEKRLRILALLEEFDGNICVCELVDALELPQYQVSQHLRELRGEDLVKSNREGTWVYYSVNPELPKDVRKIIKDLLTNLNREDYAGDMENLEKRIEMREDGKCVVGYDESDE